MTQHTNVVLVPRCNIETPFRPQGDITFEPYDVLMVVYSTPGPNNR